MNDLTKETLGQLVANLLRLLAFSLLGLLLTSFVWAAGWLMVVGVDDVEGAVKNLSPNAIRWAQVAQSIGVFALGPWLYARFSGFSFQEFIAWKGEVKFSLLLQGLLLVFLGSSAGGEVMAWMQNGPWPDALQPLKAVLLEWDARSSQAVEALLKVNGAGEMGLILVALALVPGIVEEVFFRGALFGLLAKRNVKWAFWGSTVLFAAIHLQFFALPGLLFIGLALAALRVVSGHVQYGIVAHILNNGVLAVYLLSSGESYGLAGEAESTAWGMASVVLFPLALYVFIRKHRG